MTGQERDTNNSKEEDLLLFDNVLVPNIDNELVFGLGDDGYMNSMEWDGSNIETYDISNTIDPDQEELQNLLLDIDDDAVYTEDVTPEYCLESVPSTSELSRGSLKDVEQVSPDHAREARRQRMEIILQRRGLLGKLSNSRARRQQNAAAEHAVKALLHSNSEVAMEEVQNIARQLVMNMTQAMPRSVSSELCRAPSPVLSAAPVERVVPDETLSYTPPRSSSVPPRKKAPLTSRARKKNSECTVDPTLLPDGDDPESRRQRRLIRNRMSAQLHRERKREAMDNLERMIQERDVQIQSLEQQLTQVSKKNTSLEEALAVIRQHFGAQAIESIMAYPPHLVNNSDSSSSSDEDSVPSSPTPFKKRPTLQLAQQPAKKKKISTIMMAPLCICAIIGCLSILPFKNTNKPIKYKISSSQYVDTRRRLLSAKSTTGESLLNQILGETTQLQDWVINPIENQPAQWKINHALKYPTPWSYASQELLFDVREQSQPIVVKEKSKLRKAIAIKDNISITKSNYLFCPSAHAKFTPDFLKLSKSRQNIQDVVEDDMEDIISFEQSEEKLQDAVVHDDSKALVPANSVSKLLEDEIIYKASLEGDDPYMSILLPASAVSGGNITPRRDEPWIELGCQVLSAKIVDGVDFLH